MMGGLTGLALVASGLLGVTDFLGGVLSRRIPLIVVLLGSQLVATLAVSTRLLVEPFDADAASAVQWGVIGGLGTAVGVSALFRALAIGTMGVVAPITSLAVVVPVMVGIGSGDSLTGILSLGLVIAVLGTMLASGPEVRSREGGEQVHRRRVLSIVLAFTAAVGFGMGGVSVALGSATSITTTLVTNTVVVLSIYLVAFSFWVHVRLRGAAARLHSGRPATPALLPNPVRGRDAIGIAAIGLLGYLANVSFALASLDGALSVVGVLASLYPVVTALLGWRVLGERLLRVQVVGVVAVFVGVALIASTV
jgi:drug/metabolite transporter (DMT)-like permease